MLLIVSFLYLYLTLHYQLILKEKGTLYKRDVFFVFRMKVCCIRRHHTLRTNVQSKNLFHREWRCRPLGPWVSSTARSEYDTEMTGPVLLRSRILSFHPLVSGNKVKIDPFQSTNFTLVHPISLIILLLLSQSIFGHHVVLIKSLRIYRIEWSEKCYIFQ